MLRALLCTLLTLAAVVAAAPRVAAAPVPDAPYRGVAEGGVAVIDLDLDGSSFADVRVGNAEGRVDSTATPRSSVSARNLSEAVPGLGIPVKERSQTAPPNNPNPTTGNVGADSDAGLSLQNVRLSSQARWAGDADCVSDIATGYSYVITDQVNISTTDWPNLFDTGYSEMYADIGLDPNDTSSNHRVFSYNYGAAYDISLFDGAVDIVLSNYAALGAVVDGTPGGARVDDYLPTLSVTHDGATEQVTTGNSTTVELGATGALTVTANEPVITIAPDDRSVTASVTVATLQVRVGPDTSPDGTATIDLLPMSVQAVAPEGGVDCPPPAPTVANPADGSTTTDATPTFSGTGVAGSVIDLEIDGQVRQDVATVAEDGTWSHTPSTNLANGTHSVSVVQALNGAASAASAANTFTVDADLDVPAAPVIVYPADDSTIGDNTPVVRGTGEAGATVTVVLDGNELGQAVVDGDGTWSLPGTGPLDDGEHTLSAVQRDGAANVSLPAEATFVVDTEARPPVISRPADGSLTGDVTPEVAGTAEAGASVAVSVDGDQVGIATADGDGNWSLPLTVPLAEGERTVSAVQTDAAGNVSEAARSTFTVDSVAPGAPTVEVPADDSVTGDRTPTIRGTGETGATVTVQLDGDEVGEAVVATDGTWEVPVDEPLGDGEHTVTAVQRDPVGNESPPTETTFVVDTGVEAPVISRPAAGSVTDDTTPDVVGTAEPGASVAVSVDGDAVGTVTADGDGAWSLALTAPLAQGERTVAAVQTDAAGNVSEAGRSTFTVDSQAPGAPVITAPADGARTSDATPTIGGTGEPGATVSVEIDGEELAEVEVAGDGTWSVPVEDPLDDGRRSATVVQRDGAGNVSPPAEVRFVVDTVARPPVVTGPENGSVTGDPTPEVTGRAEPGASVAVRVDGAAVGTVTANADGTWSLVVSVALAEGAHTVSAVQTDAAGNVSEPGESEFRVDSQAPVAPVITVPADRTVVEDRTPTIRGTGEAGATVRVAVDGAQVGEAPVAGDGTWRLTVTERLDEGERTVSAVQADAAGNVSPADEAVFTVDTGVRPPVVSSPRDGSVIDDSTPTFAGTAEPGATVEVAVDGEVVGTVTAGDQRAGTLAAGEETAGTLAAPAEASWRLQLIEPLADGDHRASVVQTDRAGNASDPAVVEFAVDTRAPATPVLTSPQDGAEVSDPTPTITGTGEPGTTVVVFVDGVPVGSAEVGEDGRWSLTLDEPLPDGDHTITAVAVDDAGNESVATPGIEVEVDTPAGEEVQPPADGPRLADTGGPGLGYLVAGGVLLVVGGTLLSVTRRRV